LASEAHGPQPEGPIATDELAETPATPAATLEGDGWGKGLKLVVRAKGVEAAGVRLETLHVDGAGDGKQIEFRVESSGESWAMPGLRAGLSWESTGGAGEGGSTTFVGTVRTESPVTIDVKSSGMSGAVDSMVANLRVLRDAAGVRLLDAKLAVGGGSLRAGDVAMSEGRVEAVMRDAKTVEVTSLGAVVGDGSTVVAEPFRWDVGTTQIAGRVNVRNLNLAVWLPIVTSNRATGEGRVSGSVDVGADWSEGSITLTELKGEIGADPEHGFIQTTDAEALGDLLEKQDPRFAADGMLFSVREKIIAALRDFAFKKLTVDLSRRGDRTKALTYLSGFGRHGEDPQGLNLTLDVSVQDAFIDMASRIAAKGRIKKSAGAELDDFFGDAAAAAKEKR